MSVEVSHSAVLFGCVLSIGVCSELKYPGQVTRHLKYSFGDSWRPPGGLYAAESLAYSLDRRCKNWIEQH